jgi:hypothetical protein
MTNTWTWRLAEPRDIPAMIDIARTHYQKEMDHILTPDPDYYAYSLDTALTHQRHNLAVEQLIVATEPTDELDRVIAYAWIGRGARSPYSQDEQAEAKIIHIDLNISTRKRILILMETLEHWENWTRACKIPVIVSTTIRAEGGAFLRLHQRAGYTIRGAVAYKRLI